MVFNLVVWVEYGRVVEIDIAFWLSCYLRSVEVECLGCTAVGKNYLDGVDVLRISKELYRCSSAVNASFLSFSDNCECAVFSFLCTGENNLVYSCIAGDGSGKCDRFAVGECLYSFKCELCIKFLLSVIVFVAAREQHSKCCCEK